MGFGAGNLQQEGFAFVCCNFTARRLLISVLEIYSKKVVDCGFLCWEFTARRLCICVLQFYGKKIVDLCPGNLQQEGGGYLC